MSKQEPRKKAGRPRLAEQRTRTVNLTLTPNDIEFASWLGGNNVSRGVRLALQLERERLAPLNK